jgi:hypothetical protein
MSENLRNEIKKNLWDLIKVLIPLVTAFLGFIFGSITEENKYLSNVQLQNQSYILEVRQAAYTNFFEGQVKLQESELLEAQGLKDEAAKLRQEYNLAVKTALFQIAMFSTKPVNDAMAEHFQSISQYGPCVGDRQKWLNDVQIYQNMRQEVFGNNSEQKVDNNTMLILLFKCTLP